jgi:hypothetical protein
MNKILLVTLIYTISSSTMAMDFCSAKEKSENLLSKADAHKAILSMSGSFNVNFYFKEVFSSDTSYELKNEVQTKGKDIVTPVFVSENKISLQHLLIAPNGQIIKHWRQDWEYEPKQTFEYIGDYSWKKVNLDDVAVKCKWVQTVWNSDDSPRYSSLGEWSKKTGFISWSSELTPKPLPRREYSKRNDYSAMKSINKHTITNNGWIHEEDNWKYKSNEKSPFIKEVGLNSYTRINDDTFEQGKVKEYLDEYGVFWGYIRDAWDAALNNNKMIALESPESASSPSGMPHYISILNQVEEYKGSKSKKVLIKESEKIVNGELKIGAIAK